ncbi:matrix metalloproteinase-24-like, partial [Nilaparvata lugens]|uniref:matrix metalloproteinase-24-like n=1 Tax=Nilaparvata lugens TaxID=108931 RepID=UPI00193D55C3
MAKFGYLQIDNNNDGPQALIDPNSMSDALKTVQSFGGIPQTGLLDEATIKLMQRPRCGVPDILPNNRKKREIPWSYGWNKAFITYFVGETFKISRDLARIEIKDAFEKWEKYSRLKFIETSDKEKADIVILFKSGNHGDGNPFDGKGYILAHAFSPSDYHGISGDIHFDNDENWAIDSNRH